ncbi:hypothetical protein QTP70_010650 [Hemibagrus guttatus]|uniref:Peroxisomal bifunctional enzyme n=1 Tax=Hemibagrus guttatus TaxID=175788 RepID=A0AAE0V8I8_9TELE|nr:hypothetical protein QTP70_010650 [Hemibagrus guttatus]
MVPTTHNPEVWTEEACHEQVISAVRRGIVESVSQVLKDDQVKVVVFCGENRIFCGGADIKEFSGSMSGPPLVPMIHSIEASEKLMVAAIEGVALGGGLELALGCHYRVANTKVKHTLTYRWF